MSSVHLSRETFRERERHPHFQILRSVLDELHDNPGWHAHAHDVLVLNHMPNRYLEHVCSDAVACWCSALRARLVIHPDPVQILQKSTNYVCFAEIAWFFRASGLIDA